MSDHKPVKPDLAGALRKFIDSTDRHERIMEQLRVRYQARITPDMQDFYEYMLDDSEHVLPGVRERAQAALAKVEHGICDSEPVLISAQIMIDVLHLFVLDLGQDLLGLRLREEHRDADVGSLEEDYPVFWDPRYGCFKWQLLNYAYDTEIRDKAQRKDERAWQEYVKLAREEWAAMDREDRGPTGKTMPEMPTIWMSDPKKARLFVFVYDTAGNRSESLELRPGPSVEKYKGTQRRWVQILRDIRSYGKGETPGAP
jgi:hypothetical protein